MSIGSQSVDMPVDTANPPMAENETLDLRRSPRWNQARHLLQAGASPAELAEELVRPLSGMLKLVARRIPIGRLIREALAPGGDPDALLPECRKAADHARAIILDARGCHTEEQVVLSFCLHVIREFFDQERQSLPFSTQGISPKQLVQTKETTLGLLASSLRGPARSYVADLRNEVAVPPSRVPKPSQHELLRSSLL